MENSQDEKKRDIGWNYGRMINPNKVTDGIICNYCKSITKGGITRHKHLAGGYKNVKNCSKVPECVKQEMKDHFEERFAQKTLVETTPHFDDVYDNGDDTDPSGDSAHGKRTTTVSSASSKLQPKKPRQLGPLNAFFKLEAKNQGGKAPGYNEVQKKLRADAVQKFARWMYDAGIAFNAVNYDSFKPMIEAIGQYGPGMKPPSYHEVREPLLKEEIKHTKMLMKRNEEEMAKNGCTLMADGWRDKRGRSLVNFLVNTPKGSMFIESVDASSYSHTGEKMFELLDKFVQKVGVNNVVQVVTDSASNNVYAGNKLMEKYPHLYWTPCAAHCVDLMFEDIFKMPDLKRTLERAINVSGYIYNRTLLLNMMREFTGQKDLVRPAKTRFATAFLTMRSFQQQKSNLRMMFTSENWSKSKFAKELGGKQALRVMMMPSFWNSIVYAMKVGGPLLEVLRLVDGEKRPAMGYIYEAMDRAKEKIAKAFDNNEEKYKDVFGIIDNRWQFQLHQELHVAGYFLNPHFFYSNPEIEHDEEVITGLYKTITRLTTDPQTETTIHKELSKYKQVEGLFGMEVAVKMRNVVSPAVWWNSYGSSTPKLQRLAEKILSLTCSSSGCERNWSVFEHVIMGALNKPRNITYKKGLTDLVTETDKDSEAAILGVVRENFPDHLILGEEGGLIGDSSSDYLWCIDPIDGTTNFAHCYPSFAVSIGVLFKGKPVAASVVEFVGGPKCWNTRTFTAAAGKGAFCNGDKLHVSQTDKVEQSLLVTGFGYDHDDAWSTNIALFKEFTDISRGVRRLGAASVDMCHVALGIVEAYWEYRLKPWDMAAGVLIVEEAGGMVSCMDGGKFCVFDRSVLVSNGVLHTKLLERIGPATENLKDKGIDFSLWYKPENYRTEF